MLDQALGKIQKSSLVIDRDDSYTTSVCEACAYECLSYQSFVQPFLIRLLKSIESGVKTSANCYVNNACRLQHSTAIIAKSSDLRRQSCL